MFWRVSCWGFSWNWLSSLRWQSTKRNAVPVQTGLSSFGLRRKRTKPSQSTCIQDDLRFWSFVIWLLVSSILILDRAWRVWSGCEVKCFCYITGKAIIYSVHGYNLESPKHWDELTVGTAIFHWLQFHCVCWLNSSRATNNSACIQRRSKLNWWKSTLKPRPTRVSQN